MPEIKERPILFSGPMVRAILDGRKTVTRREIKRPPVDGWAFDGEYGRITSLHPKRGRFGAFIRRGVGTDFPELDIVPCPYGMPGDRLWVRETFMDLRGTGVEHRPNPESPLQRYVYGADIKPGSSSDEARKDFGLKWKPSIHMPRPACRLLLEVTDVWVERLQDITDSQIIAEGIDQEWLADAQERYDMVLAGSGADGRPTLRTAWSDLWNSTGGDWDANPWVWCIEFKRIQP